MAGLGKITIELSDDAKQLLSRLDQIKATESVICDLRRLALEYPFTFGDVVQLYVSTPDVDAVEAILKVRVAGGHI